MYHDFTEEGQALAPYLEHFIDSKNFSRIDTDYLKKNSIHLFEIFSSLIDQGFFDRFQKQEKINFLDIGCNGAHLAMILPEIVKLLAARGIKIHFKYLGIDILTDLISELQEKMSTTQDFSFRALDASNKTAVSMAMREIGMPKADFVLIKRPVAFGLAWSKNLPHGIIATLPLSLLIKIKMNYFSSIQIMEDVKSVILALALHDSVAYYSGAQYAKFREILGGQAAENYQGAMILTTHSQWFEQLNTLRIMHNSGQGNFTPFFVQSPGGHILYYEQYFLFIDNYTHQESLTLDHFINSHFMGLLTLGYGLYRSVRTRSHFQPVEKFSL